MRIHRLAFCSIGPYNEPQEIDFEQLNDAKVFLFSGPTGAGKSTILDAITLALYGYPAASRGQSVSAMVSNTADLIANPPTVELEFSTKDGRFRIHRTLQHAVPSKRAAAGFATRQSKGLLERFDGQNYTPVSTSLAEIGAEITNLMHLTREQFTTVMMLPQGQFAGFLSATTKDRRVILQQLFGTHRFDQVIAHLKDQADQAVAEHQEQLTIMDQKERSIKSQAADHLQWQEPETETEFVKLYPAIQDLGQEKLQQATRLRDQHHATCQTLLLQRQELERDQQALKTLADVTRREQVLTGQLSDFESASTALERDGEATGLFSDYSLKKSAQNSHEQAEEKLSEARSRITELFTSHPWLDDTEQESAQLELIEEEAERASHAVTAAADLAKQQKEEETAAQRITDFQNDFQKQQKENEQLSAGIKQKRSSFQSTEDPGPALNELTAQKRSFDTLPQLRSDVLSKQDLANREEASYQQAFAATNLAKAGYNDLVARQLEESAARLAQKLIDGEPCSVCGSTSHPAPATGGTDSEPLVSDEQLDNAQAELTAKEQAQDRAATSRQESVQQLRDSATAYRNALKQALSHSPVDDASDVAALLDDDLDHHVAEEREQLEERLNALQNEQAARNELQTSIAQDETDYEQLQEKLRQLEIEFTTAKTQQEARKDRITELKQIVAEWEQEHTSPLQARANLRNQAEALREVIDCRKNLTAQSDKLQDLSTNFLRKLEASVFATEDELLASRLEPQQRLAHQKLVDAYREEQSRLDELKSGDQYRRALHLSEDEDVSQEVVAQRLVELDPQLSEADQEHRMAQEKVGSYTTITGNLAREIGDWEVLHEDLQDQIADVKLLKHVADVAAGGEGNDKRMPLNVFVLAAKLEQVAEEASKRLQEMSDGRYQLRYDDERTGNQLAGLGLKIYDDRSGSERETKTLSGGETFMASLALALGLADVVQQEAGGISMETLFIDEGFGSLDSQTLDDVMDTIRGLYDDGRVVGLVSHVEEMKTEFQTQLHISPSAAGSTARVVQGI